MRLFIIGNGFDLAHGLPTTYYDFRDYLADINWSFLSEFEKLYGYYVDYDDESIKSYLWRNFEAMLSNINDVEIIEYATSIDLGLEMGDVDIEDTLNYHWEEQYGFVSKLNDLLEGWINQIDISVSKRLKQEYLNDCDKYLSFNYTLLLEELYEIGESQIIHIHGSIGEGDIQPVIGHGDNYKISSAKKKAKEAREDYEEKLSSIMNALAKFYERTLKNVSRFISMNSYFFKSLNDIKEVYVIGCSLGDVDIPYFEQIIDQISENTVWNVAYYAEHERDKFFEVVKSLGIKDECIKMIHSSTIFEEEQNVHVISVDESA